MQEVNHNTKGDSETESSYLNAALESCSGHLGGWVEVVIAGGNDATKIVLCDSLSCRAYGTVCYGMS